VHGKGSEHAKLSMILAKLSAREREALKRFYVLEETSSQVCQAMGMEEEELRTLKAKVKRDFIAARKQ